MQAKHLEIAVGLFLVVGFFAFVVIAIQVSGLNRDYNSDSYQLTARFSNVGGLQAGAKASSAGVTIGRVKTIHLDSDDYEAVVTLAIDARVDFLTIDSIAAIQTAGVLGEQYISISIGGDEEVLVDGDEIEDTASAIVLEELIGKVMASFSK